jgi:protein required for attachment to host cells
MKLTYVLVADSTHARLFTADSPSSPLNELETLNNPEGRLHDRDITSDVPGKINGGSRAGGHAYTDETDPKDNLSVNFAKRIAKHLEEGRNSRHFEQLLVVSAPSFLGELRSQFSGQLSKLVCFELAKNLTTHSNEEIRRHLPQYLPGL